jgi:hypothetical protein
MAKIPTFSATSRSASFSKQQGQTFFAARPRAAGAITFLGRRHQSYVKLVCNSRCGSHPFSAIRTSDQEDK